MSLFETELPVYKAVTLRKEEGYDQNLLTKFGFQDYQVSASEGENHYNMGNEWLTIYANGSFMYNKDYDNDRKDYPFEKSYEEIGKEAESLLKSKGLLPDDFFLTDKNGEESITFIEDGVEKQVVTKRGVMFARKIQGLEVHGTSKIMVMFDTEGVCSVSSIYSGLEEIGTMQLVGYEEAVKRAKSSRSFLQGDPAKLTSPVKEAVVDGVKIVYYEDPLDDQANYVQPCYYFTGTVVDEASNQTTFSITVPALAEEVYR